jgi:hypothetical protein
MCRPTTASMSSSSEPSTTFKLTTQHSTTRKRPSPSPARPSVRFLAADDAFDVNDVHVQTFYIISRAEYTEEEKELCWWTNSDRSCCKRTAKHSILSAIYAPDSNIVNDLCNMQELSRQNSLQSTMSLSTFVDWATSSQAMALRGLEKQSSQLAIVSNRCQWSSYHRIMENKTCRDLVLRMQHAGCDAAEIAIVYAAQCQVTLMYAHCMALADAISCISF